MFHVDADATRNESQPALLFKIQLHSPNQSILDLRTNATLRF
jgi:hypothetical protein